MLRTPRRATNAQNSNASGRNEKLAGGCVFQAGRDAHQPRAPDWRQRCRQGGCIGPHGITNVGLDDKPSQDRLECECAHAQADRG